MLPMLCLVLMTNPVPPPAVALPPVDNATIRRLVDGLRDGDPDVRQNLAAALARVGPAAIDPLAASLKDANADKRAGAAYALALHGDSAKAVIPTLLDLIMDENIDVRRQASFAISRIIPSRAGR
jgi:HEAT repeat protein